MIVCAVIMLITSPAGAVARSCDEYVCLCLSVGLSVRARISPEPHAREVL